MNHKFHTISLVAMMNSKYCVEITNFQFIYRITRNVKFVVVYPGFGYNILFPLYRVGATLCVQKR